MRYTLTKIVILEASSPLPSLVLNWLERRDLALIAVPLAWYAGAGQSSTKKWNSPHTSCTAINVYANKLITDTKVETAV